MARSQQQETRDAQYRAALGLNPDEALPAQLGTVGGSRGGGARPGGRINQSTNGRPAPWHTEGRRARQAAASTGRDTSLDDPAPSASDGI